MPHSLVIQAGPPVTRRVLVADAILTSKILTFVCVLLLARAVTH
jgi:hypothetical protein